MSTLIVNTLRSSTGINTMTVDDLNLGGVKAWVRWDSSSGSPVIVDDYNIVSGSDGGTGKVTWTFERPFRNYNYAFDGMTCNDPATSTTTGTHKIIQNGAQSATQFGTRANQDPGSAEDNAYNGCVWVGISTGQYVAIRGADI